MATGIVFLVLAAIGQAQPRIAAIANAASLLPSEVAAGSAATIFGEDLAPDIAQSTSAPLPHSLLNTSVLIDGESAPLWYVSPTQINFQMPYSARASRVKVVVRSGDSSSALFELQEREAAPGIFLHGAGRALAQNLEDNSSLNGPDRPAAPGTLITLYLTGLSRTTLPSSAVIGGESAPIQFLGLEQGGVMQANLTIPSDLPDGDYLVRLTIGATASNAGLVAVETLGKTRHSTSRPAVGNLMSDTLPTIGSEFQMTVAGANYRRGSVVEWTSGSATHSLRTTFGSDASLTATVSAALLAAPGPAFVTVRNPDGMVSNAMVHGNPVSHAASTAGSIPPQYFGLLVGTGVYTGKLPWPTVSFGAIRFWDTMTNWADMNPNQGVFDFTQLDNLLGKLQSQNVTDTILTFGATPRWISSNPNDSNCQKGPGACTPPKDLNSDGSGTDQAWKDFITALARHLHGRIKYFELWNEASDPHKWSGTIAQLQRMAKDASPILKAVDPGAKLTTATPVITGPITLQRWMAQFLANGTASAVDIVTFHSYLQQNPPEILASMVPAIQQAANAAGAGSLPIWDSEGSWGLDANFPNPDLQAAYIARVYLLQAGLGVARFYWYQWDNPAWGTLWRSSGIQNAGTAYQQVYDWMVGATASGPCTASGSTWTCGFSRPGGFQALAVWDAAGTCSNGACSTAPYSVPNGYIRYRTLDGGSRSIRSGATINIGPKPILLQNQ